MYSTIGYCDRVVTIVTAIIVGMLMLAVAQAATAAHPDGNWIRFTADRSAIDLSEGVTQLYLRFDSTDEDSLDYKRLAADLLVDSIRVDGTVSVVRSSSDLQDVSIGSASLLTALAGDRAITLKRRITASTPADTLMWSARRGQYVRVPDVSVYYAVKLPDDAILDSGIAHLRDVASISEVAELGYGVLDAFPYHEPNDPYYPDQWNLHDSLAGGIRVHSTWHRDFRKGDVIVAIVDGGVQQDHEDLGSNLVGGETSTDPSSRSHGTRVAGIVGAVMDNELGVASIAPLSELKGYDGSNGSDFIDDMWEAMFSAPYARVLNLSWHWTGDDPALESVCETAWYNDIILVASTGNDGQQQVNYPAGYDEYVIAVGACDEDGDRLSCSNYGSHVDFVAPGIEFYTTEYYTTESRMAQAGAVPSRYCYATECATSWAAPHVSGLTALLLAYESDISFDDVMDKLIAAASQQTRDNYIGYGVVDAEALLADYMCPIAITGDVNQSGTITAADVIYIVNYVFNSGPDPLPCVAAADVNCDGQITSADASYLSSYVFSAGDEPCNACELVDEEVWDCP